MTSPRDGGRLIDGGTENQRLFRGLTTELGSVIVRAYKGAERREILAWLV